jgi:lipopolysaccharide transport system permease protein
MGFMEALTSGCLSIKQNMHLIRNVMLPIELIPVRYVLVSMAGQVVSTGILLALIAWQGALSLNVVALPVIMLLQVLWLVGLLWILAPLTVALPDVSYFVGLFVLFLLFISPIGFKPDMVPSRWHWVVSLNPVYYLTDAFRSTLLSIHAPQISSVLIYVAMCLGTFVVGGSFFRRFKNVLADYE